jgi:hypothetical protein
MNKNKLDVIDDELLSELRNILSCHSCKKSFTWRPTVDDSGIAGIIIMELEPKLDLQGNFVRYKYPNWSPYHDLLCESCYGEEASYEQLCRDSGIDWSEYD